MTSSSDVAAATARLDALYSGDLRADGSLTYATLVQRHGKWMPEAAAEHVAREHCTSLPELDSELYWGGWTAAGVGTTVHVGSLLAALGY